LGDRLNMKNILLLLGILSLLSCVNPNAKSIQNAGDSNTPSKQMNEAWLQYITGDINKSLFPDFSNAGVNFSNKDIPSLALSIFSVTDYGAMPNDKIEDRKAIQDTINAAQKAGGGIIQFPAGRFLINEQPGRQQGLIISQSNIILRGNNHSQQPTELFMKYHLAPADPKKKWTVPAMITFQPKYSRLLTSNSNKRQYLSITTITEDSPLKSKYVTVADISDIQVGDMVTIEMENIAANDEFLHQKPTREIWERINTKGVMVAENHQIKEIIGNRLYFEQPTLTNIKASYGWKIGTVPSISNVGMENINFTGNFIEQFSHHKNYIHDSGYTAVKLIRTKHSWIKNNHFVNVSNAASVEGGLANSVLLNTIEGNGGHSSFSVTFGTRNLIGLNIDNTEQGQWHGPGASHLSVGNVIWRFNSPTSRGIDAHALFPRHTLFDSITSNGFGGWGGNYKNLPNHLEGLIIWNFKQTGGVISRDNIDTLDFWQLPKDDQNKYGFLTAVNPVIVGYQGSATHVNLQNLSYLGSLNVPVKPSSLFESQLKHRLGKTPVWFTSLLNDWQVLKINHLPRQ